MRNNKVQPHFKKGDLLLLRGVGFDDVYFKVQMVEKYNYVISAHATQPTIKGYLHMVELSFDYVHYHYNLAPESFKVLYG